MVVGCRKKMLITTIMSDYSEHYYCLRLNKIRLITSFSFRILDVIYESSTLWFDNSLVPMDNMSLFLDKHSNLFFFDNYTSTYCHRSRTCKNLYSVVGNFAGRYIRMFTWWWIIHIAQLHNIGSRKSFYHNQWSTGRLYAI